MDRWYLQFIPISQSVNVVDITGYGWFIHLAGISWAYWNWHIFHYAHRNRQAALPPKCEVKCSLQALKSSPIKPILLR